MKTCDYKTFGILDVLGLWHPGQGPIAQRHDPYLFDSFYFHFIFRSLHTHHSQVNFEWKGRLRFRIKVEIIVASKSIHVMCLTKMDTEKLTFKSIVHEANNGQLCVHVVSEASKQFLQIDQYLDLDSFSLTQWTKIATIC